jgi:sialate O-acetylesterase
MKRLILLVLAAISAPAAADVRLPALFTDHMVLQQGQKNRVWGSADAGEDIVVTIGGQRHTAKADDKGKWQVTLDSLSVGGPLTLSITGKNKLAVADVLVGEVWICSGQSNMEWAVRQANDGDLESKTANFPKIRLISVPQVGTQEPQDDFQGKWEVCTPQAAANFSAVGYFFGRQLHQTLDVPIGLIDDAWGGSACEAWVRRDLLEKDDKYKALIARWEQTEKNFDEQKARETFDKQKAGYPDAVAKAKAGGKAPPLPPRFNNPLTGNARPGNIYSGVLKPTIGYGIRGVIWYQGESNASRAYQYRDLFPLMIQSWRDEWQQGDFPFYWVQLADFLDEKSDPADSAWAELREAQTLAMGRLPNTGEAVIIDLGEGRDIHPRNKQDVAKRLARWALARDYGVSDIPYRSPQYKSMQKEGNKIVLTFDHVGGGLYTFDLRDKAVGFAIAGSDKKFVWADAKLLGSDKIEVSSDKISDPVAVRYAWADNPVCNVYSREGLPLTPFRTDDWPGTTASAQ